MTLSSTLASEADIVALPKVELHCHLDGSVRPETLLELGRQLSLPWADHDVAHVKKLVRAGEIRDDLRTYLVAFGTTLSVLQSETALERAAYELVVDASAEGVAAIEVRYSPLLNQERGLSLDAVVEAVASGLARGERDTGTFTGQILCGIRDFDPGTTLAVAECAVRQRLRGVLGLDLAGPEHGHPAAGHQAAFALAARADLPVTVHAGEAEGAWAVREAVLTQRAKRVGHGTHAIEDPHVVELCAQRQVLLEVCLKSNLETRSIATIAAHPFRQLLAAGVPISLNTDNRLMSDERLSDEFRLAVEAFSLTRADLVALNRFAIQASFLPASAKAALVADLSAFELA